MSRPREKFVDDFQVVVVVKFVAWQDAELIAGFEEGDGNHEVAGELEGVGLGENEIV